MIDSTTQMEGLRALLGQRKHTEACPGEEPGGSQIEAYEQTVAAQPGQELRHVAPGTIVTTFRCLTCGGTRHVVRRLRDVLDELETP